MVIRPLPCTLVRVTVADTGSAGRRPKLTRSPFWPGAATRDTLHNNVSRQFATSPAVRQRILGEMQQTAAPLTGFGDGWQVNDARTRICGAG